MADIKFRDTAHRESLQVLQLGASEARPLTLAIRN